MIVEKVNNLIVCQQIVFRWMHIIFKSDHQVQIKLFNLCLNIQIDTIAAVQNGS